MEQLMALELRYRYLHIEKYVIMPNHIHLLLALEAAGASPRPTGLTAENCDRHTLPEIIGAFKSITTRLCNAAAALPGRKLFQTSFYEEVIRSQAQYLECWQYIENNPVLWAGDEYFEE